MKKQLPKLRGDELSEALEKILKDNPDGISLENLRSLVGKDNYDEAMKMIRLMMQEGILAVREGKWILNNG